MMKQLRAALASAALVGVMGKNEQGLCMSSRLCEGQRQKIAEDLREAVVDRMQLDVLEVMGVAPAVVNSTVDTVNDGLFGLEFDGTSATYDMGTMFEFMWHRLRTNDRLDWLYYGVQSSGQFFGFRRALQCEKNTSMTCDYGDVGTTTIGRQSHMQPGEDLVRIKTLDTDSSTVEFWPTVEASGSDAAGGDQEYLFSKTEWNTLGRDWYILGKDAEKPKWTRPYAFQGNTLGVSVARRVADSNGVLHGVMAADYELSYLNEFIKNLQVSGNASLFIMTSDGAGGWFLLGSNDDSLPLVTQVDGKLVPQVISALSGADPAAALIKQAAEQIKLDHPELNDLSKDWKAQGYTTAAFKGFLTNEGVKHYYDAIGLDGVQWVVVIVSREDDVVQKLHMNAPDCVTVAECKYVILDAQFKLASTRIKTIQQSMKLYMQIPYAAVSLVETVYNLGALSENCMQTECPSLNWDNKNELNNRLKPHLASVMRDYTELAWLYIALDAPPTAMSFGVARDNSDSAVPSGDRALNLWKTCDGNPSNCTSGTVMWSGLEETTALWVKPDDTPWLREWYTVPSKLALTLDQVAWTEPFTFSTSEVGIAQTKNMFEGNFRETTVKGRIAGDITMKSLSDKLVRLKQENLASNEVVYCITRQGMKLLAPFDIAGTNLLDARLSTTGVVRESAKLIDASLKFDPESVTRTTDGEPLGVLMRMPGVEDIYRVMAIGISDKGSPGAKTPYDWILVVVTPADSLISYGSLPDEDEEESGISAVLLICLALGFLGCVGAYLFVRAKNRANATTFANPSGSEMNRPFNPHNTSSV
eukprot:TRINITY_DN12674_c0_g1_i1.p1 TRINITY_DN12674_c0_g1~~TRINITY_DN12674_c0_g1_i1.p1  ORF type:complete len:814 (+),score=94.87 TRINITY_DN12674_c0_g1_i1:96-2537(+)